MQFFGDANTFMPFNKIAVKTFLDEAEKLQLKPTATDDRLRYMFGNLKDVYLGATLKNMLSENID